MVTDPMPGVQILPIHRTLPSIHINVINILLNDQVHANWVEFGEFNLQENQKKI